MVRETLTVITGQTPLDLLLYRRYGRQVPGLLETVLALNPGLAALGPYLPFGTKVIVDAPNNQNATAPVRVISLFD